MLFYKKKKKYGHKITTKKTPGCKICKLCENAEIERAAVQRWLTADYRRGEAPRGGGGPQSPHSPPSRARGPIRPPSSSLVA